MAQGLAAMSGSDDRRACLEAPLASQPRVRLGSFPTPLEPLPRLTEALGGLRMFVKRDDLTGLAFGRNKTRARIRALERSSSCTPADFPGSLRIADRILEMAMEGSPRP